MNILHTLRIYILKDLHYESATATYHHGGRFIITPAWHDKNVICPNSKIYYVIDGEICVETEKEILIAKKGDAILIPAGIKHSYHLTEKLFAEKYWFHFDLRFGTNNFFENFEFPFITHLGENEYIYTLFETAVEKAKSSKISDKLACSGAVCSIISYYMDKCTFIQTNVTDNDEIDSIITFIKKNYCEKFTLEELASNANISPNYFVRKFKERTGQPPLKYINNLKLERAKFLLEHSNKFINVIMEEVGFLDQAHFSKLFRATTGYSPRKFREVFTNRTKG